MILVIDNYDSFTYNLVQLLAAHEPDVRVVRNDRASVAELAALRPSRILISPGPGRPEEAGCTLELIRTLGASVPILGVCLGHQAIGIAFGGAVVHAPSLMHGRTSPVRHDGRGIFAGLPSPFDAARYHSLVIAPESVPPELVVSATTPEGVIMGVRHRTHPIDGIQFHPESVLTPAGADLVANWVSQPRRTP